MFLPSLRDKTGQSYEVRVFLLKKGAKGIYVFDKSVSIRLIHILVLSKLACNIFFTFSILYMLEWGDTEVQVIICNYGNV